MSPWQVAHEQWIAWVGEDGGVAAVGVTTPLDDLDALLLGRLSEHPFPTGDEETVSRPGLDDTAASFDSRTTMVKGELAVDEEDETRVRLEAPSSKLEVSLGVPEESLEIDLEEPDEPEPPAAPDEPTVVTEPPAVVSAEISEGTVVAEAPPPSPTEVSGETIVAEAPPSPPEDEDDGLFIPTLTKTVVSPVPTPASDEAPPDEMPPAISGETVIGPPPSAMDADGPPPASGFLVSEPDEAAQTLVRGEIPGRYDMGEAAYPDEPIVPTSKVVIDPSASGVLQRAYDEEEDDEEEIHEVEAQELDADDLVEETDEPIDEPGPPPAPPAAPPAPPALEAGPPPPPVSSANLHATIASVPPPPPVDEGWQVDAFGEHYAALLPVQRASSAAIDAEFVMRCMGLGAGASLLDVACGDGAHAVAFASRGIRVTGLDASPVQLMRASQAAQAAGVGVELISGDMRQPALEASFDAAVCLGGTLGMFGDADDRLALQQMRDRLVPGGRLMIQVLNRDYISARLPARSWWQGQGCLVLDEAQLYAATSTVHVHRTVVFETGKQFEHNMALRVYGLTDLVHMCAHVGLRVVEFSGSRHTRARFYGATSSEIWLLAQRVDG